MSTNEVINKILMNCKLIKKDEPLIHTLFNKDTGLNTCEIKSPNHESVKKLKLFILDTTVKLGLESTNNTNFIEPILVEVTTHRNDKKLYRVDLLINEINSMISSLENAYRETAFWRIGAPGYNQEQWDALTLYDKYGTEIHNSYKLIRNKIAEVVLKKVTDNNPQKIFILDLGTGLGDCLDVTVKKILDLNADIIIRAIGIDTNASNIEKAKKNFPNYHFEQTDARNLADVINNNIQGDKVPYVIVIGSGSMTRLVLNNTIEVMQILQQAHRLADLVVLGGATEMMTTKSIAKKIGWDFEAQKFYPNLYPLYILNKSNTSQIKLKNNRFLNLAFHAQPFSIVSRLSNESLSKITNIDLSLSLICDIELKQIIEKLPNLKTIQISGLEPWKNKLESHKQFEVIESKEEYITEHEPDYLKKGTHTYELKKFSHSFYKRHERLTTFSKNKSEFYQSFDPNSNFWSSTLESVKDRIVALEEQALAGDEKAIAALAYNLLIGIKYLAKDSDGIITDLNANYKDPEKALLYLVELYARGYPVLEYINEALFDLNKLESTGGPQLFIAENEYKAAKGDDAALHNLAFHLERGLPYILEKTKKGYVRVTTYIDLEKSLMHWRDLQKKGYEVTKDIKRVEEKISARQTSFNDLCKAAKLAEEHIDMSLRSLKK